MPKIKKEKGKAKRKQRSKELELRELELKKALLKKSMYKSSLLTYTIAIAFFIISLLFNGKFVELPGVGEKTVSNVFDVIIKAFSVILFFWFMLISVGNYQELRGYIATWKEMLVLIIISLLLTSTELYVFLVALAGIALVLTYMYFIQGRIEVQ